MATKPISVTLDEELVDKLNKIAAETNRKKSYYVNQALREYFEEIEDYELAVERRGGKSTSMDKAKESLDL